MEIRWLAPILDCSGYASAARGYLRACESVGVRVRAQDRSRSENLKGMGMDDDIVSMYKRLSSTTVAHDCPSVQHQVPTCFVRDRRASAQIGYTIFEMTKIPRDWVKPCCDMDVIWTGSEYSRQAFLSSGVTSPIEVLPHAIDLESYSPYGDAWDISNRRSFAFLSVFDFTPRKAWKDLLRAYWTAFKSADDVCLILKVFFGDFSKASQTDIFRKILNYKSELGMSDTAPILVYGHDVPNKDMPSLYRSADCYVGVSREGFGLSYAEAMACGLLTIGPEVGGNRQYMTEDNSYLVDYLGDEPVDEELFKMFPTFEGLSWSRHSWESLSLNMRRAAEDDDLRDRTKKLGRESIERDLSYSKVGKRIVELVKKQTGG